MNRSERRAAIARGKAVADSKPADLAELMAEASRAYQQGRADQAEIICRQVLARAPAHRVCLNLLGVICQASGRHRLAVKRFAEAIALDELDAACRYNIACSYQALGQQTAAVTHFRKAIALGMGDGKDAEQFVMQNSVIAECVGRMAVQLSGPAKNDSVFSTRELAAIASDLFLRCALEMTLLRGVALELFLTNLRSALLSLAEAGIVERTKADDVVIGLFCALAQQCFINEYVFVQSQQETQRARRLRDVLQQQSSAGNEVSALLLAAVGAYFPLHSLAIAESILAAEWPVYAADLLRRQIQEPRQEFAYRRTIRALTAIDDSVSRQVMWQYEENPYPRWTVNRIAVLTDEMKRRIGTAHSGDSGPSREILIAGCGSGQHAFEMAQYFPDARILAIDISRTSLAYAQRRTHEEDVQNIEYAQADILGLAALGRTFDRIEAVGVLHHLADPRAGLRILLGLLRPNGIMRIGLYSETARRSVVQARAFIAERGYQAAADDIRAFRQTVIRDSDGGRWRMLVNNGDFYSMSGCRDLLFNVMEHRFTIPEIAAYLNEHGLSFLGFEIDEQTVEKFRQKYADADALTNLDHWNAFEADNPQTFRHMYLFSVCRRRSAPG